MSTEISAENIHVILNLLHQAGDLALARRESARVQIKADYTPFTDVELEMEALILPFLREHFPDYTMLSEEGGTQEAVTGNAWVLDPIDGTKIYLNRLPTWGISLGSIKDGRPGIGFFYMPVTRDLYWGGSGFGAFHNENKMPGFAQRSLKDSLAFLAIPANAHRYFNFDYPHMRGFGSTAAHCCYVADGAADGALVRRVNLWDLAGVLPLLEQTGVDVEYISGGKFSAEPYLDGSKIKEEIILARPAVLSEMRQVIHRK